MLDAQALALLCCPVCRGERLEHRVFDIGAAGEWIEALVWCGTCRSWYPVEAGVLDLLTGELAYREDRERFAARHAATLKEQGLDAAQAGGADSALVSKQQAHFDWYAENETQTYRAYEEMPFWQAADALAFSEWRGRIPPGSWLLDVGCGNGRSSSKLIDLDVRILAFDVSKQAIRQARERWRGDGVRARGVFFTADATRFPVKAASMDCVLVYGVLHHVPDPRAACLEIARVLKPGGRYFGSENNTTVLRRVFDWLQRLRPLWYEEAGPEALISADTLAEAFRDTGVRIHTRTSVFVPPHLINWLPLRPGLALLRWGDRVGTALPGVRENGGLILVEGIKRAGAAP